MTEASKTSSKREFQGRCGKHQAIQQPVSHTPSSNTGRSAYTFIELLAAIFVVAATVMIGKVVANNYGTWPGIGAGFISASVCVFLVVLVYRWGWRRDKLRLQELREKYLTIYRVTAVPTDPRSIIKAEGAEVKIGDYGWEAGPIRNDGLIYLQGLTVEWTVVWHAGFNPEQIERVATKPGSQYDYWFPYWAKPPPPPPCPYPVVDRDTLTMGRPHHSHRYFSIPTPYHMKRS